MINFAVAMMDKVQIRPWVHADAAALAACIGNKKIWDNLRDYIPHPYSIADARDYIARQQAVNPVQHFAIVHGDILAGGCGIILKEDVYRKTAEIGYWIAEPCWGMGIATEAVKLLTAYAFTTFDIVRLQAEVFEHNKASMKVLQKNGFTQEAIHHKAVIKNGVLLDDHVWVCFKP
jgi:[ribosomal protein S5]-alanine N-acetyltransferase